MTNQGLTNMANIAKDRSEVNMTKVVFKVINMVLVFALIGLIGMACQQALPTTNTKAQQEAAQAAKAAQERKEYNDAVAKAYHAFINECVNHVVGKSYDGHPTGWPSDATRYLDLPTKQARNVTLCSYDHKAWSPSQRDTASAKLCAKQVDVLPRQRSKGNGYCYVVVNYR